MGIGGNRSDRIAERVQTELARLIREDLRDPRVGFVTLTGVEVTRDLRHAKVFVSVLGDGLEDTLAALGHAESDVLLPAEHILFADSRYYGPSLYGYNICEAIEIHMEAIYPEFRHSEGCNVAFVDGHVKWYPESALLGDKLRHMWFMCGESH